MSMEQAIIDHAAAIRELAAAIMGRRSADPLGVCGSSAEAATDPELEKAVTKVETDAENKTTQVEVSGIDTNRKPMGAAKQAVAEALAKAEAEKAKPVVEEDDPLDAAPLDWDKDVRPALLAVGKDRDALVKLMAKYEVPKGGKAPAEKWADLLAEANAIVAARG